MFVYRLNHRPRKSLDYKTPTDILPGRPEKRKLHFEFESAASVKFSFRNKNTPALRFNALHRVSIQFFNILLCQDGMRFPMQHLPVIQQ